MTAADWQEALKRHRGGGAEMILRLDKRTIKILKTALNEAIQRNEDLIDAHRNWPYTYTDKTSVAIFKSWIRKYKRAFSKLKEEPR